MGMFDDYEPVPAQVCPVCHEQLSEWQGKDADKMLYVWQQYEPSPVDWRVDSELKVPGAIERARLPRSFTIYTSDTAGHQVSASCAAPDGVWTRTAIDTVTERSVTRNGGLVARLLWSRSTAPARDIARR